MAPSTSSTSYPDTTSTQPYLDAFAMLRSQGWQLSELGVDELDAPPLMRGFLSADHPDGQSAIATAAVSAGGEEPLFCRCAGRLIATIASQVNQNQADSAGSWQPSPLSGVGWGLTVEQARLDSLINAVVAHRVLSSWYGKGWAQVSEARPAEGEVFAGYHQQRLAFARTKLASRTEEVATAGMVLWPKELWPKALWPKADEGVMVVGWGGGLDQEAAEAAAEQAVTDRLAFLAAEQKLKRRPRFAAGRRYALEMMMHEDGESAVRAWLERLGRSNPQESTPLVVAEAEDLSGPLGLSSFAVMKTAGAGLLPVVYGRGFPAYEGISRGGDATPAFHPFV